MAEPGTISPDKIFNSGPCVDGKFCFSEKALGLMRQVQDKNYQALISESATPDSQLKLLYDDKTVDALGDLYVEEFTTRFKPHAPQNNKLFSNFNINLVLQQLHRHEPSFKNFDCELMDFYNNPESPLGKSLNRNSELLEGIKSGEILTFGTVPNTLLSTGDITRVGHWVALFGDFRGSKYTIEYYNSSGNNAPAKLFEWMNSLAKVIEEEIHCECIAINVTNIASQKGPSECGIYSIHYVICRLLGIPYKQFREHKITDADINKLRKLFLDESRVKGKALNLIRSRMLI